MLRPYKRFGLQILFLILASMGLWLNALGADRTDGSNPGKAEGAAAAISRGEVLTLEQCLDRALQKNHRRAASKFELAMAEAQHRQALAGYWPKVKSRAAYQLLDQPMNFILPGPAMGIPAQSLTVPGGTVSVTIPANALGPGFPPAAAQMPVSFPNQTVNTPSQAFQVSDQNIKLLDRTACLVTRRGFATMCEMNPDLARKLRVVATSPKLVPVCMGFHKNCPSDLKARFTAALTKLQTTPGGNQILALFQSSGVTPMESAILRSSEEILRSSERVRMRTAQLGH